MKKIGLFCLLFVSYAGLLTVVFGSDYARSHSFLPTENAPAPSGKAFNTSALAETNHLTLQPGTLSMAEAQAPTKALETAVRDGDQSPESASEH